MRRVRLAGAVVVSVLLLAACQPGDIDASFGINGVVTMDFGTQGFQGESIVLPDGHIVVAGTWGSPTDPSHIALHKLNPNGTPDTTFGENGTVSTFVGAGSGVRALVRQPDDKLVVAGSSAPTAGFPLRAALLVARYLPNGAPDEAFGDGGVAVTDLGTFDGASGVLVQPDGKIVVVGAGNHGLIVVRYNPDGSGDTTFGWAGVVTIQGVGSVSNNRTLLRQPDGKLVIGATGARPGDHVGTQVFKLLRLTPEGIGDASFGDHGIVSTDFGFGADRDSFLVGLVLRSGGRLLAGGSATGADYGQLFALARYNPDGTLDASFGTGGLVLRDTPAGNPFMYGFTTARYGAVVLGGIDSSNAVIARFNPGGDFDSSFGSGGIMTTDVIEGTRQLTTQPNGALLASTHHGNTLARFVG